ncbi:MAG: PD40 domain-containing protein [Flavobacteriales bacterium]|nr:PD40 domain-containing protein [Flavobacteriales bacterium]
MRTIYLLFLAISFCTMDVSAQMDYSTKSKKAIKYYKEALRFYDVKRSSEAIELLKKAIKADENFVEAHTISGDCYTDLNDYENAIIEYQKVVDINPNYFVYSYKHLADAQYLSGKYAAAIPNYKVFLTKERINPKIGGAAQRSLKNAEFGAKAVKSPVPFVPTNLGESVNSDQYEYFPVLTADEKTLVFTRNQRRSGAMDYQEDFYVSNSNGTDWGAARNIGAPINTDDNEGAQTITADGSQLFFIGCNRRGGKGSCDIYFALREGRRWGKPQNLDSPVNTSKWESQPSISSDGKVLYFASNRPGGLGGSDIYVTHLAPNGEWTVPRNLGEQINTKFAEETPFIHPDGKTLYFTSDGHIGMGQKDIYVTRKDANGNWSEPKNLGYPINTWKDEMGLFVAASGETAYFSSDRKEGFGKLDLYSFPLYEDARPDKVTYVKGKVRDKVFGKPLAARFQLIDLATSEVVVESTSDKITGKFLVTLPAGHEYALNVSKNGFLFYSEHFPYQKMEKQPSLIC